MDKQYVIIFSMTCVIFILLCFFTPMKRWFSWCAYQKYPAIILVLLMVSTFFLSGWRGEDPGEGLVGPLRFIRMIMFISLAAIAFCDLALNRTALKHINAVLWLYFLYGVIAFSTAIISPLPALTSWKAFEVLVHVLVVASIARRMVTLEDAALVIGFLWLILLFTTISTIWGVVLYPELALRTNFSIVGGHISQFTLMYGGVFPRINPNEATQIGAIVTVIGICLAIIGEKQQSTILAGGFWIIVGLATMYYSHSRTSIFALTIAFVILVLGISTFKLYAIAILCVLSSMFVLLPLYADSIMQYLFRGQQTEQLMHLSGRIGLWEHAFKAISENPLIGHGYYAAHRVIFGTSGLDNAYLNVVLGGGVLLFLAFVAPIAVLLWQIVCISPVFNQSIASVNSLYSLLWAQITGALVVVVIRNFTGPSFESHHFSLPVFLLCSAVASRLYALRSTEEFRVLEVPPKRTIEKRIHKNSAKC